MSTHGNATTGTAKGRPTWRIVRWRWNSISIDRLTAISELVLTGPQARRKVGEQVNAPP